MRLLLIEDDALIARELGLRWQARGWAVSACTRLADADAAVQAATSEGPYARAVPQRAKLGLPISSAG